MKNVTRKGKKMARRAGFQINREDIIRAAIKQISKYGFSNFTLSNLSKELNITKAALYWHFKSKNDILMEVLKYIELEYISKISEICDDKSLSASEKLKNYLLYQTRNPLPCKQSLYLYKYIHHLQKLLPYIRPSQSQFRTYYTVNAVLNQYNFVFIYLI